MADTLNRVTDERRSRIKNRTGKDRAALKVRTINNSSVSPASSSPFLNAPRSFIHRCVAPKKEIFKRKKSLSASRNGRDF